MTEPLRISGDAGYHASLGRDVRKLGKDGSIAQGEALNNDKIAHARTHSRWVNDLWSSDLAQWHFEKHPPRLVPRNPVASAFFTEEAVERPGQALVRESIQNSLGARLTQDAPVKVRFAIGHQFDARTANYWFAGAWPHFLSKGSGVRGLSAQPTAGRAIVVEDFGTVGLEGDPAECRANHARRNNHFFGFLRAEGISDKEGQQGGRWGIGKTVFPRSSRINTMFALTIPRSTGDSLLMGRSILKHHSIGDTEFTPDGHFGVDSDDVVLPVCDETVINRFSRDFGVARTSQTGLSVIVPYADPEITFESIVDAVVREYFWPIISRRLVVVIDETELSADHFRATVAGMGGKLAEDMVPALDFADWVRSQGDQQHTTLIAHPMNQAPKWTDEIMSVQMLPELRRKFRRGDPVAFRVPTCVSREALVKNTQFNVYLQRDLEGKGTTPTFIRSDIIVPEARSRRVRNHSVHVMVTIDDEPLAAFLGDAEPPAHTHWSVKTERFQSAGYKYGSALIDFVRNAPSKLAEFLSAEDQESDAMSLADFFPREEEDDEAMRTRRKRKRQGPDTTELPEPPTGAKPKAIMIDHIEGGFVIRRGDRSVACPRRIDIRVAYDRSRGSPLGKYHLADFRMKDLDRASRGLNEVGCDGNRLRLEILDDDFEITVRGFDTNRDLFVKVSALNSEDKEDSDE